MAILSAEKLDLGYEGQTIVSGLEFSVNAGDYLQAKWSRSSVQTVPERVP